MRAKGMFISECQESFTYQDNLDYILQRTSDGLYTDALFYTMLPEVQAVERRGAVHNFRPQKPWLDQALLFLRLSSNKGFEWLVGDYESGVLDEQAAKDFFCFMRYIQQERNKPVAFYTTIYTLRDNLLEYQGVETDYGPIDWYMFELWLARWILREPDEGQEPLLTIHGKVVWEGKWRQWQYWADGNGKGAEYGCGSIDTNLDVYNGTPEEMDAWLGIGGETDCCDGLRLEMLGVIDKQNEEIYNIKSRVSLNTQGIAEIAKRIETLQQGQLEITEDVMASEKRISDLHKDVVLDSEHTEQNAKAITDLNTDVNDLQKQVDDMVVPETNHHHGKLFCWLFCK